MLKELGSRWLVLYAARGVEELMVNKIQFFDLDELGFLIFHDL